MARPDLLLDDRRDYTLEPRPYFSALQVRRCAGEERGGRFAMREEKKREGPLAVLIVLIVCG